MPPSEAQKRAAAKWDKENVTTLGCKVKKEEAAAFKEYAARQGKAANTVLKEYVIECIEKDVDERDNGNEPPQTESVPNTNFQLSHEERAHIEKRRAVLKQLMGTSINFI